MNDAPDDSVRLRASSSPEAAVSAAKLTAIHYRDAMAKLGAAVSLITTDGPAGRAGFTASAVCSVTDSPPTLLVCLNRGSSASEAVHANGVLCVNVLAEAHRALSARFGGKTPMLERFEGVAWAPTQGGAPRLADAIAAFDCRIASAVDVGTHAVLICEVIEASQGEVEPPLFYFARDYHTLPMRSRGGPSSD